MRRLMIFCFTILFVVLSALSCLNFAFSSLDQVEEDKLMLTIEKPAEQSNSDFLTDIDHALAGAHADLMFRHVDNSGEKSHYQYYKTNHTADFLDLSAHTVLESGECLSTTEPVGYTVLPLHVASLMQDISFFPWADAGQFDLTAGTYYVKMGQQSIVADTLRQLGYTVTIQPTNYISGQFSVLLFGFVPAFMLIASIAFYILSNGKQNVLKKMEGYITRNILADEVRSAGFPLAVSFLAVEGVSLIAAAVLYRSAWGQYILFSLPNFAVLFVATLVGLALAGLLVSRQKSAEHIKGRVPKRGIYVTTILAKIVFVTFLVFFLSIAVRNAAISYHSMQTADYLAEKVAGYVTIPVNTSNTSTQGLADHYKDFYAATVDLYHGVLIDASNYEYDLIGGKTLAQEFGQTSVTVNRNYLEFNPIYGLDGSPISSAQLSNAAFNVLLPESREQEEEYWREYVRNAYSMETNFIFYDGEASKIYTYNADTGTGNYGAINEPVILVVEEEQMEGIFVLSYCSQGSYFLKVDGTDPYQELLPVLRETGIAGVTLSTPSISDTFSDAIQHQRQMLILYGTQSAVLLAGLFCLILFSAKLYCENYKKKIASCLIEGYSTWSCLRKHFIVTVLYYGVVILMLQALTAMMQVSLDYILLLGSLVGELVITLIVGRTYAHRNLYQIVKGAD